MIEPENEWTLSLFIPDGVHTVRPEDPNVIDHSLIPNPADKVARVSHKVMEQWSATLDRLMDLGSLVDSKVKDWAAEEITVGFTLSAKGELLFIAEAGATASISVKLKRKPATD